MTPRSESGERVVERVRERERGSLSCNPYITSLVRFFPPARRSAEIHISNCNADRTPSTMAAEVRLLRLLLSTAAASAGAFSLTTPPPVRRTTKAPIVPLSNHLYSYGADKLQREIAINGVPAKDRAQTKHTRLKSQYSTQNC